MCLSPGPGRFSRLDSWLAERGITPRHDNVLAVQNLGGLGLIRHAGAFIGNSPILKGLEGAGIETDVPFQSFAIDRTKQATAQLRITELMEAPDKFWGETTPFDRNSAPEFDPKTDTQPPWILAAQVEKGASADPALRLDTARLVVFGIGDLVVDRLIEGAPAAGLDVSINALNWLLSRENLISLPPKEKNSQVFKISTEQVTIIGLWVMLYIPLIIALFGLFFLWWRHGKNLFILTAWVAGIFLLLIGAWYLLLYSMGDPSAKSVPKGLIIALATAAVLGAAAVAIHFAEQKKRLAAQR